MKRFTDTEKWRDQWYRKLAPRLKCLWSYICDTCDPAGVFEVDWELATFSIGEAAGEADLKAFGDRIEKLPSGKYLIKKFIPFQYVKLALECRGHRPVIKSINHNNLVECYADPEHRVCIGYTYRKVSNTEGIHHGIHHGAKTGQDKISTSSVPSEAGNGASTYEEIKILLCKAYGRSVSDRFDYTEESMTAQLVRERPQAKAELEELLAYREVIDNPKFFPHSIDRLLGAWNRTLDAARNHTRTKVAASSEWSPGPTMEEIRKMNEEKIRRYS